MHDFLLDMVKPQHLLLYLFAYGLSATPTSYLIARIIHRKEISKSHPESHAASYIYSHVGQLSGLLVLLLDLLKGLIPCAIAYSLEAPLDIIALVGFFSVLGHCFSVWLSFFGGHGAATQAGYMLILYWPAGLLMLAINWLFLRLSMEAGRASIIASIFGLFLVFFTLPNKIIWIVVAATTAVIVLRHRARIFS